MPPKKRACPYRQAPNVYNNHKIGGFEMSRGRRRNGTNTMQCFSNAERRIGKQRLEELKSGCRAGVYSPEILKAACKEFEFIEPLILLSIRQGKSFDRLQILWELGEMERPAVSRSGFYRFRRRFFANLDRALKERGTEIEAI
ncbi:MAG: hypothetical protein HFH58_17600 [Lachnospiraceae bacterium]|nr:hypothetical protein [Lachnospiraceae bacterium]